MGKLIILRGNSGSGKTTVAKELQKKFGYNTMLISQDEIRRNILWVKDGIDTKRRRFCILEKKTLNCKKKSSYHALLLAYLHLSCYLRKVFCLSVLLPVCQDMAEISQ